MFPVQSRKHFWHIGSWIHFSWALYSATETYSRLYHSSNVKTQHTVGRIKRVISHARSSWFFFNSASLVQTLPFLWWLHTAWKVSFESCFRKRISKVRFPVVLTFNIVCLSRVQTHAGWPMVKVVMWSGGHLTKPGWSKPHTHSTPN